MSDINNRKISDKEIDELWTRIQNDIVSYEAQQRKAKKRNLFLSIAAIGLVAIVISSVMLFKTDYEEAVIINPTQQSLLTDYNYQTGDAERTEVTLPDGSTMWMNAHTRAYVPTKFTGKNREVIVDGEAYFDVVRDTQHPFIVKSSNTQVEVLGTKFAVKDGLYAKESNVVLVSGSVMVDSKNSGSRTKLQPNQRLKINETEFAVENVNAEELVSWIKGIYTINEENLSSILKDLANYYGVKLKIEKEINTPFSGKIDLGESFESILIGFKTMKYIEYQYINGCYIIY